VTTATSSQTAKTSSQSRAGCGLWLDVLALAVILLLNWICYVRVINGYFLADDFLHVDYLQKVFAGDTFSLLKNFWGNWMQAEGTTFYRPLISLTLALDYLFFGANAAGFHLSNFLFQTASSLLLYLVIKDIGRLFMASGANIPAQSKDADYSRHSGYPRDVADTTRLGALAAAAVFSVSPLHCEVVAWIIARVDSVACMFYLASMSLFLLSLRKGQKSSRRLLGLSLLAFALSLCSKEMAITLPPTIGLLLFLTDSEPKADGFRQRFFGALKKSLPFWAVLTAYMILRTLALGTISGGYQGSIGEGLSSSLAKRWLFDGSFLRVLFPLNIDVFGHGHGLFKTLKVLYILAAVTFAAALLTAQKKGPAIKSFVFGAGWLLLTLLPTYQVWNLTETLQGSRFIYFGTMPLAYLLSLAVLPPVIARSQFIGRLMLPLQMVLLSFFVVVFATITCKNNQPWQHAMKELKTFQEALCHLAESHPDNNIVLLNIPQSYRGAHMLYNGATMSVMLRPPLAKKNIVDQIYTFEPATFGDADLISVSRLRRLMSAPQPGGPAHNGQTNDRAHSSANPSTNSSPNSSPNPSGNISQDVSKKGPNLLYFWDRDKFALESLVFDGIGHNSGNEAQKVVLFQATPQTKGISIKDTYSLILTPKTIALSPSIDLPASQIDAIIVKVKSVGVPDSSVIPPKARSKNEVLKLIYKTGSMALPMFDNSSGEIVFQLSEHKNWLKQGMVHELSFETLGSAEAIEITSIEALNFDHQLPRVEADGHDLIEGPDGICRVHGPRPTFSYDVSNVPGATAATCEVSKPNSWFEHYSGTLRDKVVSKNALSVTPFNKLKGRNILLSFAGIKDHGFYQIKVAAVDKDGKVLGYFSDPLNFQI
jgi:hypothetical protein